jgi:hypothetical protein
MRIKSLIISAAFFAIVVVPSSWAQSLDGLGGAIGSVNGDISGSLSIGGGGSRVAGGATVAVNDVAGATSLCVSVGTGCGQSLQPRATPTAVQTTAANKTGDSSLGVRRVKITCGSVVASPDRYDDSLVKLCRGANL